MTSLGFSATTGQRQATSTVEAEDDDEFMDEDAVIWDPDADIDPLNDPSSDDDDEESMQYDSDESDDGNENIAPSRGVSEEVAGMMEM